MVNNLVGQHAVNATSNCVLHNNNLEKFMLETKCSAQEAHRFFEQNTQHIYNIDEIIDLYITINKVECHICLEKQDKLYMFIPCEHRIICYKCAKQYQLKYTQYLNSNIDKCPMCREKWSMITEKKPLCVPPPLNNETTDGSSILFIDISDDDIPIVIEYYQININTARICKFYKNGYCVRGDNCSYIHSEQHNNIQRPPKKEEYCKHFLKNGNCNYNELCFFIHDLLPISSDT